MYRLLTGENPLLPIKFSQTKKNETAKTIYFYFDKINQCF